MPGASITSGPARPAARLGKGPAPPAQTSRHEATPSCPRGGGGWGLAAQVGQVSAGLQAPRRAGLQEPRVAGNEAWDQTQSCWALDRQLGETEEPGPVAQGGGCWLSSRVTFCQEPEAGPLRPHPCLVTSASRSCGLSPSSVLLTVPVGWCGPTLRVASWAPAHGLGYEASLTL